MYCSSSDLSTRLTAAQVVALADDDGDGVADTSVVDAAITDADAEIDVWLAPRYQVPFTTAPAFIASASATLAAERLFRRHRDTPPEALQASIDETRAMLERISKGQADLPEDDEAVGRARSDSTTRDTDATLDADALDGF